MPLDTAAAARPRTPVNKKKRKPLGSYGTAPFAESALDASTASHRADRSVRDRMLGLSTARRPGGTGTHPMSVGTAGMPEVSAPAPDMLTPQYGETRRLSDAQDRVGVTGEDRQQALLGLYFGQGVADSGHGMSNTFANIRQALQGTSTDKLRQISPYYTPQQDGLRRRYRKPLTEEQLAAGRERQAERDAEIAGRRSNVKARGIAKGEARQKRMADRTSGGGMEQQLVMAAANGSRNALAMLDMIASGKRTGMQTAGLGAQREADAGLSGSRAGLADSEAALNESRRELLDKPDTQTRDDAFRLIESGDPEAAAQGRDMLASLGGGTGESAMQSPGLISSGIDRTMGEGASTALLDAAGNTEPSFLGGLINSVGQLGGLGIGGPYANPTGVLQSIGDELDKLQQGGALDTPEQKEKIRQLLLKTINPKFLPVIKK